MRINANHSVVGHHCILVPYCSKHVQKYHGWMSSEELRRETFSEALTLEQEQQMQRTWAEDADKLTFIILDRATVEGGVGEIASMVGDINAFLCPSDQSGEGEESEISASGEGGDCCGNGRHAAGGRCFELSVMLAERGFRRRGIALQACKLMIAYILRRIGGDSHFVAKIGANNRPSLALFRDRLNFRDCAFSKVFDLITLRLGNERASELVNHVHLNIQPYHDWAFGMAGPV